MRGYGITCRLRVWRYGVGAITHDEFKYYVDTFTGPSYYFMYPFERAVASELIQYCQKDDPSFLKKDPNPAWKVVYNLLKEHDRLHNG